MDQWGIWDPVEQIWLGDEKGPRLFDSKMFARVAAELSDVVLGYPRRRCREKPFPIGEALRLKDQVDKKMSDLEALQGMEDGRYM
jgi:hypothetical protein